jgi:hypothetical protein
MEMSIKELLQILFQNYTNGEFVPLLEADIVGYFYHLWISKFGNANKVHLDTRVCATSNKRFDFVIGDVKYHTKRPCIEKPELVIEFKSFPLGFTNQQHRVHYLDVIKHDIPKLASIKKISSNRYILLFDEDGYLEGLDTVSGTPKLIRIKQTRDKQDPRIKIIYVKRVEKCLECKLL